MAKSSARSALVKLVAVHTSESDGSAANLVEYLDRIGVNASYHKIVDDNIIIHYVPDHRASWALRSGNGISLNICITGFARQTRDQWLRRDNALRIAAAAVRDWCERYNIPMTKLTPGQVGANYSGIIGHHDWTIGKNDGTHWDPGPEFPWDVFIRYVKEGDDDMANVPQEEWREVLDALREVRKNVQFYRPGISGVQHAGGGWLVIHRIDTMLKELANSQGVNVEEVANMIASETSSIIASEVPRMVAEFSAEDLERIATAVADETSRRMVQ